MNYKQTNNKTATYGEKSQSVSDLQTKLNSMGANLKVDSMYGPKTQEAYNKYMGSSSSSNSSKYNTSSIESPTPASDLRPTPKLDLPEPEAVNIYNTRLNSLESNLTNLRKSLEDSYKTQKETNQPEIERLQKEQEKITAEMDPTKRATYDQEKGIEANQLKAAKSASATLEQDFMKRRKMVDELEGLMNMANATLGKEKGMPLSQRVLNARTSRTMSDISARAGVLESVFSALDGNISQAHNLINQAQSTVSASWNDNLNYYRTLLDLKNKKLLTLDEENKEIAEKEIALIESDIKKLEETSNYVKELMIDPESAQFIADAGVKLNDSIEVINEKMAQQARIREVNDIKNEMTANGYEYVPFPTDTIGLLPINVGGQTLYFKDKGAKGTASTYKLTPTQRTKLLGAGLTLSEVDELHNSIQQYGIESVVNAITDETQRQTIADIYGYTPTEEQVMATKEENESYIRENLTKGELKDLADWLGVSKWWRRKTKDINQFFEVADEEQLNQIRTAVEEGYTVGEIISFLNEI